MAAVRADRNEAIAVTGALLYWLPAGDLAWPEVALTLGRLSYDRYTDPWPGAEPPDPDDLDAACDLLLRGARYEDADERTTLYLFLALRDREHLLACPADAKAVLTWGRRLLTFPGAGGLGRDGLHDALELELLNRADARDQAVSPGSGFLTQGCPSAASPLVSKARPAPGRRPEERRLMHIHRESIISATPLAVYDVLTDGQKFTAATGMPGRLRDREGETWRFGAAHPSCWEAGVYSVVRFTLSGLQDGTRFVIDHAAVPPEWHDHISGGYPSFYQQPLERYFAAAARP